MLSHRPSARAVRPGLLAVLLLAVLALAACGSSEDDAASAATGGGGGAAAEASSGAPEPFVLRWGVVSVNGNPEGPNGLAYQEGRLLDELKAAGVTKVDVATFPNGPNLAAALISGAIDVGELGDTPALVAGSQGIKAKLLQVYQQGNEAWLIGRKGGPRTLEELKGKRVATAPGSYMDRYLKGLLKEQGLSGDVQVGAMLPPAGVSAIQKGSLDAYAFPFPLGASLAEQGLPVIDQASRHEGLAGNSVTLISDEALAEHPQLAQAWRAATKASNQAVRDDPDGFWAFEAKINKVSTAAAKASYPVEHFPLEPYPADALTALQGTLDFLVDAKAAKSFDLAGWRVP
jgi:NitT/TauT family transport system substrate-binding protein/sulfonate transport system substrate-binding protein